MDTNELIQFLEGDPPAETFTPYCYFSKEADALTFYFADAPDYSKRLTDHVTLFLSIDSDEVVGCRVKGVSGIIEDLPNFIQVAHERVELSIVFLSLRGTMMDDEARSVLNCLGRKASEWNLTLEPV